MAHGVTPAPHLREWGLSSPMRQFRDVPEEGHIPEARSGSQRIDGLKAGCSSIRPFPRLPPGSAVRAAEEAIGRGRRDGVGLNRSGMVGEDQLPWDFLFENCVNNRCVEHPNDVDTIPMDGSSGMVTRTFHWKPEDFPLEVATYMQCDAPWDGKGFQTGKGMLHKLQQVGADEFDGLDMLDEEEDLERERERRCRTAAAASDGGNAPPCAEDLVDGGWADFAAATPPSLRTPSVPAAGSRQRPSQADLQLDFDPSSLASVPPATAASLPVPQSAGTGTGQPESAPVSCPEAPAALGGTALELAPDPGVTVAPVLAPVPAVATVDAPSPASPEGLEVISALEMQLRDQAEEIQRLREALAVKAGATASVSVI